MIKMALNADVAVRPSLLANCVSLCQSLLYNSSLIMLLETAIQSFNQRGPWMFVKSPR